MQSVQKRAFCTVEAVMRVKEVDNPARCLSASFHLLPQLGFPQRIYMVKKET
jgi:hypothetical protein